MTRLTSAVAVAVLAAGGSLALIAERRLTAPAATPETTAASAAATPRTAGAFHDVTIPEGTPLPLVLDSGVSTATARIDDPVRAHLASAVIINGVTAIPQGSVVVGTVTATKRSEKVKGRAHIAIRFENVRPAGRPDEYDGAAYTLDKRGRDVGIAAGRQLSARLLSAITVRVPVT